MKKTLSYILPLIAALSFGIFIGVLIPRPQIKQQASRLFVQPNDSYTFTNPLLDCEVYSDEATAFLQPFEHKLEALQDHFINKEKLATHISIYFRDLSTGTSFGVNEGEHFTPASLLKVPVMIAYLKLAERDPAVLTQRIEFTLDPSDQTLPQNIKPSQSIQPDNTYTFDQLIEYSIVHSDNYAQSILYDHIKGAKLDAVYADLGIKVPGKGNNDDYMSVREYASFFRILYNSTYLSRDMSEKALELLSKVDYDYGIRAGLPADIVLANKFGERRLVYTDNKNEVLQLHDCGIIYYTERPYLLCVMTRGNSFEDLTTTIRRISLAVYEEVSK